MPLAAGAATSSTAIARASDDTMPDEVTVAPSVSLIVCPDTIPDGTWYCTPTLTLAPGVMGDVESAVFNAATDAYDVPLSV
jgi:hypothetical protein